MSFFQVRFSIHSKFNFLILESESKIEGFKFLEKMRLEWISGKNRFNKKGEALYGIFENNNLLAIGGTNLHLKIFLSKSALVSVHYCNYRMSGENKKGKFPYLSY